MRAFLDRWLPSPTTASGAEQLRAAVGALCGLLITAVLSHFLLEPSSATIFMIAPVGASAVLLFALPASPLAQPWSAIGGNVVSEDTYTMGDMQLNAQISRLQNLAEPPDVIFLSEAFTRPHVMHQLAKLGFTQSYTYFTWKNTAPELREFLGEFSRPEVLEYYRGNLFTNTPDILHEYLQHGGLDAFRIRLVLAGTLSPLYGIYSGYELGENVPVKPGSEEYLDSEKYELKTRDYDAPGNINADVQRLNRIRRTEPALQQYRNLTFHESENPQVLFYRKAAPGRTADDRARAARALRLRTGMTKDVAVGGAIGVQALEIVERGLARRAAGETPRDILVVVNMDPHRPHETMLDVPLDLMGIREDEPYVVVDLLTGARYTWRGRRNYVRLDPATQVAHVLRVER